MTILKNLLARLFARLARPTPLKRRLAELRVGR